MRKLFILSAILAVTAGLFFALKSPKDTASTGKQAGILISHKTAGLEFPENSVPGFEASLAMPVDAIELDVHVVKDGVVLHHDPVLSSYNCFEKGDETRLVIAQMTVAELTGMSCHNHKVDAPYKIVTLGEFLEIYATSDQSKLLLLEIKVWDNQIEHNPLHEGMDIGSFHYAHDHVAETVLSVLREFPDLKNIQFNTFSRDLIVELQARALPSEDYDYGLLYKGHYAPKLMGPLAWVAGRSCHDTCWAADYKETRAWLEANNVTTFIPHFIQATVSPYQWSFDRHIMRDRGDLKVIPWTLNLEKEWASYQHHGFDGILTDKPTAYRAWVTAGANGS